MTAMENEKLRPNLVAIEGMTFSVGLTNIERAF
jgi:hypothetical protein